MPERAKQAKVQLLVVDRDLPRATDLDRHAAGGLRHARALDRDCSAR